MAIVALNLASTWEFVSELDPAKGTEEATRFRLGALDARVMAHIRDLATSVTARSVEAGDVRINMASMLFAAAQFGLRGWTNLRDSAGNDVPFRTVDRVVGGKTYKVVAPELLELLPFDVVQEIGQAVLDGNSLSKEEAKN